MKVNFQVLKPERLALSKMCLSKGAHVTANKAFGHVTEGPRISLGTKFELKLIILFFLDQIFPKMGFPVKSGKIALIRASMVVTYYIKLFCMVSNRQNGILMSLLL